MQSQSAKRRNIDVSQHQVQSNIIHPDMRWNDEMDAFYIKCWGLGVEMDLFSKRFEQWSELCHSTKRSTKCSMCGGEGHTSASYPYACCLKCGEKTKTFQDKCANCLEWSSAVCELCGYRGHIKNDCPNHWKCYHSTIDTVQAPDISMLENQSEFKFDEDCNKRRTGFYNNY